MAAQILPYVIFRVKNGRHEYLGLSWGEVPKETHVTFSGDATRFKTARAAYAFAGRRKDLQYHKVGMR